MSADDAISMSTDCVCRTERDARILRTIFRRTRIDKRHLCVPYSTAYKWVPVPPSQMSVAEADASRGPTTAERMQLYAEHSAPLAVRSATSAIASAKVSPREITHLISVSCTGFEAPGIDVELMDQLGLSATVERIHVGFMGCHGAINGMRVALGVTAADRTANALLVATELCSLHFCFSWEPERLVGNALFADGSAAMLCKGCESEAGEELRWRVAATGSCLFRDSRDAITWRIGDFGYEMSLSNEVPELIKANLRPWLQAWLEQHELSIADVGSWAIHPGGPRILDAVEESLGLSSEATRVSRGILRSHGNMSSPTVLFILEQISSRGVRPTMRRTGFRPWSRGGGCSDCLIAEFNRR